MFVPLLLALLIPLADETAFMPEPTPEIKKLVLQLGDNSYKKRELATHKLKEIGWPALKAVRIASHGKDYELEIQFRAKSIYQSYFNLSSDDKEAPLPPIWFIDEKLRFPDGYKLQTSTVERMGSVCQKLTGKDIAAEFYRISLRYTKSEKDFEERRIYWNNEYIGKNATYLYIKSRLLKGEKHADLKKILNTAAKNYKECVHYYQTDDITVEWPTWDWTSNPPGPMIKKEDFVEPNGWGP